MIGIGLGVNMMQGGGGGFSPASLFTASQEGDFWSADADSLQWIDQAGTTPPVVDSPIGKFTGGKASSPISWTPNAADDAKRPVLRADGSLRYWEFDKVDDVIKAPSAYTQTMDFFIVMRRTGNALTFVRDLSATGYFATFRDSGSGLSANAGTPTFYINGVLVDPATRAQMLIQGPINTVFVLEARGVTLTTWTEMLLGYTSSFLPALDRVYAMLCRQTISTDERASVMTWLAAKGGVTL
jgi:hypothetical protein